MIFYDVRTPFWVLVIFGSSLVAILLWFFNRRMKFRKNLAIMEKALNDKRETFQLALEAANEGLWDWDAQKQELYLGPRYYMMLGYEPEEFPANRETLFGLIHPEDVAIAEKALVKTSSEGEFMDFEFRMRHKSGEWRWMQCRGNAVKRDEQGKVVRIVGTTVEIHSRKEAEERLASSEMLFKAIVNTSMEGMVVAQDNLFVYVNPKAEKLIGASKEELLFTPFAKYVHPEDREKIMVYHSQRMANLPVEPVYDFRMVRPDGATVWFLASVSRFHWEGRPATLSMITDITERKNAEIMLRQSENKFSRLFRLAPDPVILVRLSDQVIADVNEAFTAMFGFTREEASGQSTKDLGIYVNNKRRDEFYENLGEGTEVNSFEIDAIHRNGAIINLSASCQKLFLDSESFLLVSLRDMTEKNRMNEMMIQTEKMISVGGIAAGIAHEINNPLGIILQAAQNMEQRVKPDFKKNVAVAKELGLDMHLLDEYFKKRMLDVFLNDIKSAAARAATIIRHMLEFSRRSESKRTVCDLADIVDRAINLASSDYDLKKKYDFKRIKIKRDYAVDLPVINCTITEIEQVMLNLLRNSAYAMGAAATENPTITIRMAKVDDRVRLSVEDNGPGVPVEMRNRIFEPFFTTKEPGDGTGLGLSVSYFIVTKSHGGQMVLEDVPSGGARFVIDLPSCCGGEG